MFSLGRFNYLTGFLLSLIGHLVMASVAIVLIETRAASAVRPPDVFTVTLEGGKVLGGVTQVPEKEQKNKKTKTTPLPVKQKTSLPKSEATKKLEKPSVVDDPEIEKKKREAREKQEREKKKKQEAQEKKRKQEADRKRKAEEKRKKQEKAKKEKEEKERKREEERQARDEALKKAIERASQYSGESYDGGGEGFGAARTGGSGSGGGVLKSREFILYSTELREHIKGGWRWIAGNQKLTAKIRMTILPSGVIQDATTVNSSGNAKFDESVLRAIYKSSPVPPAPSRLYSSFREVFITFDSHER